MEIIRKKNNGFKISGLAISYEQIMWTFVKEVTWTVPSLYKRLINNECCFPSSDK